MRGVLAQEIHHRVKNNLQTVASLLRLQARGDDVDARRALDDSVNRILAIAAVHEVLTERRDESVDLGELLERLRAMLVQGLGARQGGGVVARAGVAGGEPCDRPRPRLLRALPERARARRAARCGSSSRSGTATSCSRSPTTAAESTARRRARAVDRRGARARRARRHAVARGRRRAPGRGRVPGVRRPEEVFVFVRRGDRYLVLHRAPRGGSYWHGVAGALEPGEDYPEAARRELEEETGLVADPVPVGRPYAYPIEEEPRVPGARSGRDDGDPGRDVPRRSAGRLGAAAGPRARRVPLVLSRGGPLAPLLAGAAGDSRVAGLAESSRRTDDGESGGGGLVSGLRRPIVGDRASDETGGLEILQRERERPCGRTGSAAPQLGEATRLGEFGENRERPLLQADVLVAGERAVKLSARAARACGPGR